MSTDLQVGFYHKVSTLVPNGEYGLVALPGLPKSNDGTWHTVPPYQPFPVGGTVTAPPYMPNVYPTYPNPIRVSSDQVGLWKVVGHCVKCGNPIYAQASVTALELPTTRRSCDCGQETFHAAPADGQS